jgi:hypothetical protein
MKKKSGNKPVLSSKQKKNWRTILEKANKDKKFRNDLDRDFDKAVGGVLRIAEEAVADATGHRRLKMTDLKEDPIEYAVGGGTGTWVFDDGRSAEFAVTEEEATSGVRCFFPHGTHH